VNRQRTVPTPKDGRRSCGLSATAPASKANTVFRFAETDLRRDGPLCHSALPTAGSGGR
jgi:hypothetical protein